MRILSTILSLIIAFIVLGFICKKDRMSGTEVSGNFILLLSYALNIYFMWN